MKWADKGGGDFKQPPAGTHQARCIKVIDLGTQKAEYQGQSNIRRQVLVMWELPSELMEDGRPFVMSKFYTQSLNEKSRLYADLVNWRGREFTQDELHGVPLAEMAPGNTRPCPCCGAIFTFSGEDASKVEELLDQLRSRFPGASVEVTVRTKRPWWRFWGGSR